MLGFEVIPWALRAQEEMRIDRYMCIAEDLEPDERRWMIAHSIGHWLLHPGNHLWIYKHTSFGGRIERGRPTTSPAPCSWTWRRRWTPTSPSRGK